jgi:hypothetical protein
MDQETFKNNAAPRPCFAYNFANSWKRQPSQKKQYGVIVMYSANLSWMRMWKFRVLFIARDPAVLRSRGRNPKGHINSLLEPEPQISINFWIWVLPHLFFFLCIGFLFRAAAAFKWFLAPLHFTYTVPKAFFIGKLYRICKVGLQNINIKS